MNKEVIILKNLSKKYLFNGKEDKNKGNLLRSLFPGSNFYALRNVNLKINNGEHVGVIGKNGAGKTILLKVIAGIVCPSDGNIIVKKLISPIFEFGAGFHSELTGYENVYLYGSLLGVKMKDIKRNFNSVVNFSELGKFLDLKIKYYSTGMRIRLAFSIASLLKPEILILDEALSLGDQGFIKKVHEKIYELQRKGVTTIVSSHSKDILKKFCTRGIVLYKGHLTFDGGISEAINYYEQEIIIQDTKALALRF